VIKGLGLGGAERLIVDSLPYLNQEQFDYEFAYMLPWKDFLVPTITKAGLPVHCLNMQKTWHFPSVQRRLQKLIRERRYDLIHADLPVTGVWARLMGRRFGIPVIYTEHNLQERYHPLTRRANALTFGWNDCVLAVSEEVTASINRFGLGRKTRVKTLLNGVPVEQVRAEAANVDGLREEFGIPKNNLIVGTVAVFRRQKRLQDWLEVASRVAKQQRNATFLLVGHGPEEPHLRAKIKELNLGEQIVVPGFRPDGRRVMALMDIFLMTSEFEGLPMALLEAMALAKPVVATMIGGVPKCVIDRETGILVGPQDEDRLTQIISERLLGQNPYNFEKLIRSDYGNFLLIEMLFVACDDIVNGHFLGGIELNIILKLRQLRIESTNNNRARQRGNFKILCYCLGLSASLHFPNLTQAQKVKHGYRQSRNVTGNSM
jgi:glycosyltransferase involved in cell wall biosynthesis